MRKTLQILVTLFVALSVHSVVWAQLMPVPILPYYSEADYSATLQVGVPATGTISADEDRYYLNNYGPNSPVRGYTVALKADVTYTICATVRTADGKPANLDPFVALLPADADHIIDYQYWSSSSSSEVYSKVTYTPEADGNYCVLGANCFYGSSIESAYYSISVYETPYCTAENAEYTAIGLGENTGTLSFASDAYYYSSGDGYNKAKFLKVSLKAGETYSINYQLSKKAKGAYGLAPYIAIDGVYSYSMSTNYTELADFSDSCSVQTITITPEADGDCKIAIWNGWGGPVPCEYDYKLTIRQLDKANGLDALDCSTEYTVGSVISGSLNADDKQVYCSSDYYGYAEGYSVNVPDDGNKYAFFFKEESDNTFKNASVVLFKEAFSDAPFAHTEGFPDPIFLTIEVSAGQYKLALMSDQMNSADYKFAIRKVATQPSDIDFSRKLTVGKSQSEYADPFSTQPLSTSESFFAYCSGYSVELEKGVTYKFSTTAKDVLSALALFAEGDINTPLKNVTSDYDSETKTYSAEFYYTPVKTGTYNLVAQFGNGYFGTPVKYMVEEVSSLADFLNNATELTGTHTAQLDFSKDAQLFDSGLESVMLLGKAYKMSLAEGELLVEQWSGRIDYLLFNKDAEGNFQMSGLNSDSEQFTYFADADTVLYFVLAVQPNVSNEKVSMSGFVCKPIVQLLDGAVEVAQLPYTASGVFNVLDKDAQMCISPLGPGGVCGVYKLNIAKGEYVNYSFEATAIAGGVLFVYSKVDGEYVFVDNFDAGAILGGYDQDTVFYVANFVANEISPYNVTINNGNAITLTELFNGATEIGNLPFYAEGNSAQNSTLTNIREYLAEQESYDSDYFTYANAYKLSLKAGESVHIDYSSECNAYMLLYGKNGSGEYEFIYYKNDDNYDDSFYGDGENCDFTAPADMELYIYVAPLEQLTQTNWAFNVLKKQQIKKPDVMTLTELFDGATEIGDLPFYAEGNSAQNSTLVNIREYTALPYTWNYDYDYFTYANAYKLSLKAGESVRIDYSSECNAYMLLYSKNSSGGYEPSVSRDNDNSGSFYGNGEYYDVTAPADTTIYIYVAPYDQMQQTNWAFNVVMDQGDIKTPVDNAITLFDLFDGATEIGSVPFYAEGNSAQNSTLTNIRKYTAKYWNYDYDYITYANAYKLSLKAGEVVHIDYSSEWDAYMLLYSKNSSGEYEFIDYKDGGNGGSFYESGEFYDYTASADIDLYIYVAPYYPMEQTDWAFNVVKDQSDIKTPLDNAITLTELFNGATEIGTLPFYAEGNSAQNSTLTNIRKYWESDCFTYANAYKLSLKAGESVHIDYSSAVDAYMILYSKNSSGEYEFIDYKDDDDYYSSFYGNGEYYDYTASADMDLYIYVAPYNPFTQTDWAFNVMKDEEVKVPSADLTLADLLDTATEVDMNALRTDGYAMYFGEATELYNTSNYIPWANNLTTTAVAYKFLVPAGANVTLYNLKNDDYEGFYFRKTANGYKYYDWSEKLMRDSAGDTLYVVSLNYAPSTYAYVHVLEFYENVTELKYPDFMFEQEPTKEDVMVALFENNPYFVNCFGDTIVVSLDEIERNGKIKGCNINMAGHELTYYVSYNISYLNDCYNINVSEIKARFGVSFTLAVSATGNGTVNSNVSGKYLKDTEVAISAVPAEHYHFVKWSNGSLKANDTILVVSDTALVAEFAIDTYNVELSAENGTVTGAGEYGYGSAAAIAATPAEGYHFVQWSNGSTKATDTIVVVSDTALVAEFAIDTLKVVLNAENGTVTGAGEYAYGTTVTIGATPAAGYVFVKWSDGNTDNPRTITVKADVELTAIFEPEKKSDEDAIDEDLAEEVAIYAYNNTIVVENAEEDIFIYNAEGRMIARETVTSNRMEMQMTEQGIYIVRTGDKTQRVFVSQN